MRFRFWLIFAIAFILFVIGCDNNKNIVSQRAYYPLPSSKLDIAVVGDNPYIKVRNITYVQKNLKEIMDTKNNTFDGLIITKEYFTEAVKPEYKDFFSNITYPVFFIGTENLLTNVFLDNRLTLETAKIDGFGANVSGFVKTNGEIREWGLYLSNHPTKKDINDDMILRIANIMENFKINNQ